MGVNNLYLQIEGTHFDSEKKRFCVRIDGEDVFFGGMGDRPRFLNLEEHDEDVSALLCLVGDMKPDDKMRAFGYADLNTILKYNTISKIKEKYNTFVNRPRIGDEVECDFGYSFKAIILDIFKRGGKECATLLVKNDESVSLHPLSDVEKTGRHFDNISISALAEYMGAKSNF